LIAKGAIDPNLDELGFDEFLQGASIMRFWGWLLRGCAFVAAAIFIVMLVGAQTSCPIPACKGPEGDAWMPALFFAPLGLPALVMSVFFIAKAPWPNSPLLSRAGLWLKYLLFVLIALAILTPFIFGYLKGRQNMPHHIQVINKLQDVRTNEPDLELFSVISVESVRRVVASNPAALPSAGADCGSI
jgi:hypothetical protein